MSIKHALVPQTYLNAITEFSALRWRLWWWHILMTYCQLGQWHGPAFGCYCCYWMELFYALVALLENGEVTTIRVQIKQNKKNAKTINHNHRCLNKAERKRCYSNLTIKKKNWLKGLLTTSLETTTTWGRKRVVPWAKFSQTYANKVPNWWWKRRKLEIFKAKERGERKPLLTLPGKWCICLGYFQMIITLLGL